MPKITDVATIETLTNDDSLFVNTGGSLRQILMNDISVGGGMMDLLWENPNPSAEFAAQTVNVNLSGYDTIEIVTTFSAGGTNRFRTKLALGENTLLSTVGEVVGASMKMYMVGRNCSTNANGVIFNTGGYKYFDAAAFVESNTYAVPYRIYGVRNNLTSLLSPSVKIDKLWTNPSPTASFDAQTISLDLSNYDEVEIKYAGSTSWTVDDSITVKKERRAYASIVAGNAGLQSTSNTVLYLGNRTFTVSDTGVVCSAGYALTSGGSYVSSANNVCIPIEIYGIKIETTPVIGGMTKKLLWENASPSSEFAAQNISLDLNEYDAVEVEYSMITTSNYHKTVEVALKHGATIPIMGEFVFGTGGKIAAFYRTGQVSDTGFNFSNGYQSTPSTDVQDQKCGIPVRIYGIKGVR